MNTALSCTFYLCVTSRNISTNVDLHVSLNRQYEYATLTSRRMKYSWLQWVLTKCTMFIQHGFCACTHNMHGLVLEQVIHTLILLPLKCTDISDTTPAFIACTSNGVGMNCPLSPHTCTYRARIS